MWDHILNNPYASVYATHMPGVRDGDSCPVSFNRKTGKYCRYYLPEHLPVTPTHWAEHNIIVIPASIRDSDYPAVIHANI